MTRHWTPDARKKLNERTTARLIGRISQANRPVADAFVRMKRAEGLASGSLANIAAGLRHFDETLAPKTWDQTGEEDVTAFLTKLRLAGKAHASIVLCRSAVQKDALAYVFARDVKLLQNDRVVPLRNTRSTTVGRIETRLELTPVRAESAARA